MAMDELLTDVLGADLPLAVEAYDGTRLGPPDAPARLVLRSFGRRAPGNDSVYVVSDDPDGLFRRASAAGAEVVQGLVDEDHGSRGFTVRDAEDNLWSFGTYAGE